ncbi:LON peptidase substrate-binding domain-containing protein [Tundrisphaera sp. TA3]|uniref:LON peptidase substrate-binding domain-containing protein n=1 Tax=Tundrisphaera sp. TA3 TaxID=3435775 RepID=UPI003EBC50FF
MDDDYDLKNFDNVCRLFPLPGVVLFPHAVLPLHIFEPRYRQMTEDALASDGLITIVQLRPPEEWASPDRPALEEYGCLGRIVKHERLPDGRFRFLLLGRKRVRLGREIPSEKLYRSAEVEIVEDVEPEEADLSRRIELIGLFRRMLGDRIDPDLNKLFDANLSLGILTDIIAQAIGLSPTIKQSLLEEPLVAARAAELVGHLEEWRQRQGDPGDRPAPFPPPFSRN